jgi:hypothetical protein
MRDVGFPVNLPLSGAVNQGIRAWNSLASFTGSSLGLINIIIGRTSAPEIEEDVLSDVGSYGLQLGRIEDALIVLLRHFPPADRTLSAEEKRAIRELEVMLDKVADVKERAGSKHVLRPQAD